MDQKINHPQEHQSVDEEENLKTRRKNLSCASQHQTINL